MSEHPGIIRHHQERKIPGNTQGFFKPFIGSPTFTQWDSVGPLVIRVYMGVVQNYGTRKLPLRRAFANLSRPFAPQQNRDMGLWSGFRVQFSSQRFTGGLYFNILLDIWLLDIGFAPIVWKAFEVATLQKELTHFGPALGPGGFAFREPFADLSRTFRGFIV